MKGRERIFRVSSSGGIPWNEMSSVWCRSLCSLALWRSSSLRIRSIGSKTTPPVELRAAIMVHNDRPF
jgi:hypothetical protein